MIDQKTGSVLVGGKALLPGTTETEFLATTVGKAAKCSVLGSTWTVYTGISDEKFTITPRFKDHRLTEVQLRLKQGRTQGWGEWSEAAEQELKVRHDKWLAEQLGRTPYQFVWGEVLSVMDQKGGVSSIVLRYRVDA